MHWNPTATFLLALFAMIPLAERLGFCTESLADLCGDTVAGEWRLFAVCARVVWNAR